MLGVFKNGGGKPGPFYHMNEVPNEGTSLRPLLVVFISSTGVLNVCKAKSVPLLVQNKERVWVMHPPHPTPVCLPSRHWHHSRGPGLPPSFLHTESDKNWTVSRPGNEARKDSSTHCRHIWYYEVCNSSSLHWSPKMCDVIPTRDSFYPRLPQTVNWTMSFILFLSRGRTHTCTYICVRAPWSPKMRDVIRQ